MTAGCGFANLETFSSPLSWKGHGVFLRGRTALDLAGLNIRRASLEHMLRSLIKWDLKEVLAVAQSVHP